MDVIFLNGASSSGKSAIAKALQAGLDRYYLHVSVDAFIEMMPEKSNNFTDATQTADGFYWRAQPGEDGTVYRISAGSYGVTVNDAYRTTVRHLINSGLRVIVDDVIDGAQEWAVWQEILAGCNTLLVGVVCEEAELVARERTRGDRMVGSAIEQAHRVHQGMHYDLVIDTTTHSATDCAAQIVACLKDPP